MNGLPLRKDLVAAQSALGQLVADFHVEASMWPNSKAMLIRLQADALDGIRVRTLIGMVTVQTAFAWLDAGRITLADLKYDRTLSGNSWADQLRDRWRDARS